MRRDFEIIDLNHARGRRFGHNLTKYEFDHLLDTDLSWPRIMYYLYELNGDAGDKRLKYYIRYGATINESVIKVFTDKRINYIPVIKDELSGSIKNKLSHFSKEHSKIIMGQIFSCVRMWLTYTGQSFLDKAKDSLQQEKKEFERSFKFISAELDGFVSQIIEEVLSLSGYLSILALYDELIFDINTYFLEFQEQNEYDQIIRHNLEVVTRSIILGRECGLRDAELENLAMAAFLHDIGLIPAYDKCMDAFAHKVISPWNFELSIERIIGAHAALGAVFLSDDAGKLMNGINYPVREMVLQHEQYIDGSGISPYLEEYDYVMREMGIAPFSVFYGNNTLPAGAYGQEYYKKAKGDYNTGSANARQLLIPSQILNIIEKYVTFSEKYSRETALRKMLYIK